MLLNATSNKNVGQVHTRNCTAVVVDNVTAGVGYYRCHDSDETIIIKEDIVNEDETTDGSVITTLDFVSPPEPSAGIIKEDIVTEDETTDGSVISTADLVSRPEPVHLENEVSNAAVSF